MNTTVEARAVQTNRTTASATWPQEAGSSHSASPGELSRGQTPLSPWSLPLGPAEPGRWVPVIPESAPFTPEQRAWLNGFLAGLFSYAPVPAPTSSSAEKQLQPLTILYGSQTGNAERLAKQAVKEAASRGFAATVQELGAYDIARLAQEKNLLIVTSTYGDGEPPDNARAFWQNLVNNPTLRLAGLRYSVCALGDRNYTHFCKFGRDLDAFLEQLGAQRIHARQDCDTDFEEPFRQWLMGAFQALANSDSNFQAEFSIPPAANPRPNGPAIQAQPALRATSVPILWSRKQPFPARLLANHPITSMQASREVRHFAISLEQSGLQYEPGDALGVWPTNDPALVEELLQLLNFNGEEEVPGRDGQPVPLRQALLQHYELNKISDILLQTLKEKCRNLQLPDAASHANEARSATPTQRLHLIDLLQSCSRLPFAPAEFVALLRPLQPRFYSIASSPLLYPAEVHLTVRIVRYELHGRIRKGVCSTYLAERVPPPGAVPVFLHKNPAFRLPPPDRPLIMVGPGTGIAPFRAFLQHRQASGARGQSWLFFGGHSRDTDFFYQDEIHNFLKEGVLTRLDLAWSREQAHKIYVQHRMLEHAKELWHWLEQGAAFYVCGDATRMARDVDAALHQIIQQAGGLSPDNATEYVARMRAEKRYCRDVY
ncbi:MAG: sulfite reductase subunit alpha [Verrucomicrobiota bacterium]|nr:sulfite reductase subunit alpha [Limisphaera sp.]MDW8382473.1 sulfite reductase subunit alpha [Verrucomicrobiota bacterium]